MNRQKSITRDFEQEGEVRAQQLGAALAQRCDPEFLETILNLKGALDEFGGQVFIAAQRDRFNSEGNPVDSGGRFLTWGYITHYGHKVTIRQLETEEEARDIEAPPEPDAEGESNGTVPEPVEA